MATLKCYESMLLNPLEADTGGRMMSFSRVKCGALKSLHNWHISPLIKETGGKQICF